MAAQLSRRDRVFIWLARHLPRALRYWSAVHMMSEHVGQPDLPTMSSIERAMYCARLRMNHVVDEFARRT